MTARQGLHRTINVHPFLLAVFPFLFVLQHNAEQLMRSDLRVLLEAVGVTLLVVALVWWLLNQVVKDKGKSALIVSLSLILFFSYGHFGSLIENHWQKVSFGKIDIGHHKLLLSVWLLILGVGAFVIVRKPRDSSGLVRTANVFAMVLVLISAVKIGSNMDSMYNLVRTFPESAGANERNTNIEFNRPGLRDIYYIVLERYAANSSLKNFYGLDNKEFLAELADRGFYIAEHSRANYPKTAHSLSSSLNMEYINYLQNEGQRPNDWRPIYRTLKNHKVGRTLKNKGYRFVHIGGWWEPTRENEYADVSLNFNETSEIMSVVWSMTAIYPVLSKYGIGPSDRKRKYFHSEDRRFEVLKSIPNLDGPTFTFAHMYITHDPYVFDRNCKYLSKHEERSLSRRESYIESLECANTKILETVEAVLSQYRKEELPIIILQGDEGPFPGRYRERELEFDWEHEATEDELKMKYRILNAYYFPDEMDASLYVDITPVNSFRVVFNTYFNEEYELLEDKSYVFKDGRNIYDLFDVTETVDY